MNTNATQQKEFYISATQVGAMINTFLCKNIAVNRTLAEILTEKDFLTETQAEQYKELVREKHQFIFSHGMNFEADAVEEIRRIYHEKYLAEKITITNYNDIKDKDGKPVVLRCKKIKLSCVPDLLVEVEGQRPVIIEIKSSNYNTELIESYKYQLAAHVYLIAKEKKMKPSDFDCRLLLQKPSHEYDGSSIQKHYDICFLENEITGEAWGSPEDVKSYIDDIITALNRLWAFRKTRPEEYKERFEISFEDLIKPFLKEVQPVLQAVAKIEGTTLDAEISKDIIVIDFDKETYLEMLEVARTQDAGRKEKKVKEKLKQKLTQNIDVYITAGEGETYKVSYRKGEVALWTAEDKAEAIKKAEAIEIGSKRRSGAETIKITSK